MKKKVLITVGYYWTLMLILLGLAWGWLYWHPMQRVGAWTSGHVRYPNITFQPYNGLGLHTPPSLFAQSETFNDATGAFAHEMVQTYGDSLSLDYTLEHDKNGTDVIFTGQGTGADGTVVDIEERMHFDIVIRKDAKWH